jgi:hypothetical protein
MKAKQLLLAAAAAMVLTISPSAAQLTSNPLEPGFYNYMRELYRGVPGDYRPMLVNDRLMLLGSSIDKGGTMIEYISPRQLALSAIVTKVRRVTPGSVLATYRRVSDFNSSSSVGTLYFDESSGLVTMKHNLNPSMVGRPSMAAVVTRFAEELREQRSTFNRPTAEG